MIRDVVLYTSGGTDPFTNLPTSGGPITGNGSNGQLLRFHPNYARLLIFITSLSGTSPSIQFTVGSYYGPNNYTLPPITSPQYVYIIGNENKTIVTYLNTSGQVLQQVELPYNIFLNGVNVSWSVSGTSPSISAYIHFEFEDEEEGEE
jgi:hypothetical protein